MASEEEQPLILICPTLEQVVGAEKVSYMANCSACNVAVAVAGSSKKALDLGATIYCAECAVKEAKQVLEENPEEELVVKNAWEL